MEYEDKFKEIKTRWEKAEKRARTFIQTWEECYEFTQPNRPSFYTEVEGERRDHRIYDSSPVTYTQEFANKMQSGLAPSGSRWATFTGGSALDDDQRRRIQPELDQITGTVFDAINESNFADSLNEILMELSLGTSGLLVNDPGRGRPINHIAVPLPALRIDNGWDGKVDTIFRTQLMRPYELELAWGKTAVIPEKMRGEGNQNKYFKIRDVVFRDWSKKGTPTWNYYVYCDGDDSMLIFEDTFKGRGANPWIISRWSTYSSEAYGRGPVFNALGDIKALNLTMQLIFENAEMSISGMWTAIDDGVLNMDTVTFVPGVVLPVGPNGGIQPLQPGGNFDVSMLILKEMRQNIRKALFADTLGAPEGTPMSATEVAQRMSELARTIGAPLSRLWNELFVPYLERVVYILNKRKDIDLPLLDDKVVNIVPQSPLARASRNEDISQLVNFSQVVGSTFGPQIAALYMKDDKIIEYLADLYNIPANLIRNSAEREQTAQQLGQAATDLQSAGLDPNTALQSVMP